MNINTLKEQILLKLTEQTPKPLFKNGMVTVDKLFILIGITKENTDVFKQAILSLWKEEEIFLDNLLYNDPELLDDVNFDEKEENFNSNPVLSSVMINQSKHGPQFGDDL